MEIPGEHSKPLSPVELSARAARGQGGAVSSDDKVQVVTSAMGG